MPSDTAFRLSLYLTLSLACVCVGYAEFDMFPEVPFISAAAVLTLVALYRLESRVQMLSIPEANRMGLIVGLMYLAWAVFRIVHVIQRPEMGNANLQLILVALFGPLLVALMPAKLARREQHVGDYWALQVMGLVAVCLSAAMTEDPICSILVGLYAATAIWSLSLFHLRRAAGVVAAIPNRPASHPIAGVLTSHEPQSGLRRALKLSVIAGAIAIPLYLVTPRSPGAKLEFGKPRVEIGYAASQMIDLNQTGNLEENPAPAFEVLLNPTTGLIPELPDNQLWRGRVLRNYTKGTWEASDLPLPGVDGAPKGQLQWTPPRLGPGQCALEFTVPSSLPGQFLAEPIVWAPDQPVPVASMTSKGALPWLWGGDGSFLWSGRIARLETHHYVQVWQPRAVRDLSPTFHITDPDPNVKIRTLIHNPVRRVKEYGDGLVDALIQDGKLPADCRDPVTDLPRREFHDQIAKAFSSHLATWPAFTYTTKLRRVRKDLDPIEEFLFHTRAGHCERFASALALLLRSQGIPAVLVLGFKGWEPTNDPRRYIVKQEHAHAWVDALIVEFEPARPGQNERPVSCWRTLDPTPGGQAISESPSNGWAGNARTRLHDFVRESLANFSTERLLQVWASINGWLLGFGGLTLGIVLVFKVVRRRKQRAVVTPGAGFLGRLLSLLAAHGFTPQPGDTPREFTQRVADSLGTNPRTAVEAGIPRDWVEAYYESRFGARVIPPERIATLDAGLRDLERCLVAVQPTK